MALRWVCCWVTYMAHVEAELGALPWRLRLSPSQVWPTSWSCWTSTWSLTPCTGFSPSEISTGKRWTLWWRSRTSSPPARMKSCCKQWISPRRDLIYTCRSIQTLIILSWMLNTCFTPFMSDFSSGIWAALLLTKQRPDLLQSRQDSGRRDPGEERQGWGTDIAIIYGLFNYAKKKRFNYAKSSYRLFLDLPLMKDDICASIFALLLPTDEAAKGGGSSDASTLSQPATKWPSLWPSVRLIRVQKISCSRMFCSVCGWSRKRRSLP